MSRVLERLRLLKRASRPVEPALPDVARSVAIIMDGNARWARSRGLPVLAGHSAGTRALRRTVEACLDLGVNSLAVFAFSTENWNRPDDEVRGLLDLLAETIKREFPDMGRMGVRVRFVGRRDRCSPEVPADRGHRARHGRQRRPDALDLLRLRRPLGARRGGARARARRRRGRGRRRGRARRPPERPGHARARPRHPHLGRAAALELPALADRLQRVRVPAHALARLRRGPLREALAEYAGRRRRFGAR